MRLNRTKHVRNEVIFPKITFYTSADLRTDPKVHFKIVFERNAGFTLTCECGLSINFISAMPYDMTHIVLGNVASVFMQ